MISDLKMIRLCYETSVLRSDRRLATALYVEVASRDIVAVILSADIFRRSNKAFKERVAGLEGTHEFLLDCGFKVVIYFLA